VQNEILAKYPKADVRVYAIWFNMFPGDSRSEWPPELLTDPRVTHRWDEAKVVGTFFGQNKSTIQAQLTSDSNGTGGAVLWDSYLLYRPEAKWDAFPDGLTHWGRTIVAARESLRKEFERLFGAAATKR
jgi:hypothetical protein